LLVCGLFAPIARAQVTFERLLNSGKEPQNWLTYSGDYSGRRFSFLDQINLTNARSVVAKWVYQTGATGKLETTPLVVDGFSTPRRKTIEPLLWMRAPDVRSGRFSINCRAIFVLLWRVNRGLAILGDKVFLGTLDAHVIGWTRKPGV